MVRKFAIAAVLTIVLTAIASSGCSDPKTVIPDTPKSMIKEKAAKSKDLAPPPPMPPPPPPNKQ